MENKLTEAVGGLAWPWWASDYLNDDDKFSSHDCMGWHVDISISLKKFLAVTTEHVNS